MVPFFLPGSQGKLFAVNHLPDRSKSPEHAVMFFAPFAEEMNKSRRMMALQARQLAALGCSVLLVDCFGTGDSEGDFSEARWEIWEQDMLLAYNHLRDQGCQKFSFIGFRLGALLAMQVSRLAGSDIERIIFWQPVISGQVFMNQFLRLKIAAEMLGDGGKITTNDLRELLKKGEHVEIAGYELSGELFNKIESIKLQDLLDANATPVSWFEISMSEDRPLPVVAKKLLDKCEQSGVNINLEVIKGESFWITPEITVVDDLLQKTTSLFKRG